MRETDDILTIFHCLDEQKLLDMIPRHVSDAPDTMPSLCLYEGDLNTIVRILDTLKEKMAEYGAVLSDVSRDVRELQVRYKSAHTTAPSVIVDNAARSVHGIETRPTKPSAAAKPDWSLSTRRDSRAWPTIASRSKEDKEQPPPPPRPATPL